MITFDSLGINPDILRAIGELGFEYPTPVQEASIPAILKETKDIIALAQTGTGKTAAFGLPIIELTEQYSKSIQTLILCPTRELCIQITKDIENYTKYNPWFKTVAVYGGASTLPQIQALKAGCHLVVGTPGRVVDLMERKVLKIENIKYLVLDEADEMLNMGFKDDIDNILSYTPESKRTFLFSATMPPEVRKIAKNYMHEPIELSIDKANSGAVTVQHEYYMVHAKDRYEALKRLADINPNIYGIIFCRTRQETKEIAEQLITDDYNADALHGDLSQAQRDHVMHRFRSKNLQLLVATDVAARGIDVDDLTHIINYKLPDDLETYIHRSGRTGRAGKTGVCISILHSRERNKIKDLERMSGKKFIQKAVPKGIEICEKKLFNIIDKVENVTVNHEQIDTFLPVIYKKLEWLDRDELIKHFVSVEFNRFLEYYKNSDDLNVVFQNERDDYGRRDRDRNRERDRGGERRKERSSRDERKQEKQGIKYSRFHLNQGSRDDISAVKIIGMVNDFTRKKNIEIGRIEILKNFSFFEVDNQFQEMVINAFKGKDFNGNSLTVELSKPDPRKDKSNSGSEPRVFMKNKSRGYDSKNEKENNFRKKSDRKPREKRSKNRN